MRDKRLVGAAVIGAGIVGYFLFKLLFASDDEAPIRVRNGSMDITLDSGIWRADGREYAFYDGGQKHKGHFWVKVTTKGTPCYLKNAKTVTVAYREESNPPDANPFKLVFQTKSAAGQDRTYVDGTNLRRESDMHLVYPKGGRVVSVSNDRGDTCSVGTDLVEVAICSSKDKRDCKEP